MAEKKSLVNIDFGGSSSIKNIPSATAASSDCIVLTDASDGGKAKKGPSFGSNDGKFLRHDGSWETPAGGTTKYLHHIVASWGIGSGSTYKKGTLAFDFLDTTPTPYSSSVLTFGELLDFIKAHFSITGGTNVHESLHINGQFQYRNDSNKTCFSVNALVNDWGSWYVEGISINSSSFNFTSEYAINWIPASRDITLEDVVG